MASKSVEPVSLWERTGESALAKDTYTTAITVFTAYGVVLAGILAFATRTLEPGWPVFHRRDSTASGSCMGLPDSRRLVQWERRQRKIWTKGGIT